MYSGVNRSVSPESTCSIGTVGLSSSLDSALFFPMGWVYDTLEPISALGSLCLGPMERPDPETHTRTQSF